MAPAGGLHVIRSVVTEYGPSWAASRLAYEGLLRLGGFERAFPPIESPMDALAEAMRLPRAAAQRNLVEGWQRRGAFFLRGPLSTYRRHVASPDDYIDEAENAARGRIRFYRDAYRDVGDPPVWDRDAVTGARWPSDAHWSRVADLSRERGDIKNVWEPSRFTFTFPLVRAFAGTGDTRFPAAFWSLLEGWLAQDRPERGPHWRCGQEMSDRLLAWTFGLYAFAPEHPPREGVLVDALASIWLQARHIERIHWYAARCVKNNHAISEAVALFTVGTLFPFLPHAARWRRVGARQLAREVEWQVYDDGSYVQHSTNYARLAAQLLSWALAVDAHNGRSLEPVVRDRAKRLATFLIAMTDHRSGDAPNAGANDGTLLLPLSSCPYEDYRPSVAALAAAALGRRVLPPGPWDEEAAWLMGPPAASRDAAPLTAHPQPIAFPDGGWYIVRGDDTRAYLRCPSYRHRPSHADALHLDVWYGGRNVLVDGGSFSYNAPRPWGHHFASTASHNTVTVDGADQMRKGPRFMWFGWTRGRVTRHDVSERFSVIEAEHEGYDPITHRRTVVLRDRTYVIMDELVGADEPHEYRLHWLVADGELTLRPSGGDLTMVSGETFRIDVVSLESARPTWVRASEDPPRGWTSTRYGSRRPAWSLACTARARAARFATIVHQVGDINAHLSGFACAAEEWVERGGPHGGPASLFGVSTVRDETGRE